MTQDAYLSAFVCVYIYMYIYICVEKSRQTRDVMETGCLLSTMQRFGLLDLLQDLNSSCFNDRHFPMGENSRLSVGAGVVGVGSGFFSL